MWKYPSDYPDEEFDGIEFGYSADCIGDINGDNLNDFAVTSNDNSCLYIFLGNSNGIKILHLDVFFFIFRFSFFIFRFRIIVYIFY